MASESTAQLIDMAAGTAAGVVSRVIEYPMDTMKVRFQTERVQTSVVSYFMNFVRNEGLPNIFRGLPAPVAGAGVENLIIFWMFGSGERFLQKKLGKSELNMFEIGLCGGYAGVGVGFWLTPVEWVKCRMQTPASNQIVYRNTFHCFRHTLKTNPMLLTNGLSGTLLREGFGNFFYFLAYRFTRGLLWKGDASECPAWVSLVGGGMSGIGYWCSIFPVDLAKSRIQSGIFDEGSTITSILKYRLRHYGIRSWYSGLAVTLPRGVLANAIIFAVYEKSKGLLEEKFVASDSMDVMI